MNQQLEKIPGVIWGFSQPIADNMEEAVSGVKGELSVKIYGDDLKTLEDKGNEVVSVMSKVPRSRRPWSVPHHRPAEPYLQGGPQGRGALRHQCRGHSGCDPDGGRRQRGQHRC